MASPLALVSTSWSNVTLAAAFAYNFRESLIYRVNRTTVCACILMSVDWEALRGLPRTRLDQPNSSCAGLLMSALPEVPRARAKKDIASMRMLAAVIGWGTIAFLVAPLICESKTWPFFENYDQKEGQVNATHISGHPRADFDSAPGVARLSRAVYGVASTSASDLRAARDRAGGSMFMHTIAKNVQLCLLDGGGGGEEPLCKIHLELGGSVYRFKKGHAMFLSARWMRDGSDTDGRARAFLEGIAPYAAARLPKGVVRPGASRVALLYAFSSGREVISSVVVPELGAEEMREYAMPPETLFVRLRKRFLTEGPGGGTSYEGDLIWVRQVQWAIVFALGAWLAHLPTRSRGGAPMGKSKTSL